MMMKRCYFLLILGMLTGNTLAQSSINVEDISSPNDVFPNSGDSAEVVVRGHRSIELIFYLLKDRESSKSQPLYPSKTEIDASDDCIYYFRFPTGTKYRGQTLTISSHDENTVLIDLDLRPKQVKTYRVSKPFNLIGCYPIHREKALDEKRKGNYEEALEELRLAKSCPDKNNIEYEEIKDDVNNCKRRRRDGDEAFKKHEYKTASDHYKFLCDKNPLDTLSKRRYKECQNYLTYECDNLYNKAIDRYKAKKDHEAIGLFKNVILKADQLDDVDNKNKRTKNATEWLDKISEETERIEIKKQRIATFKNVLTYEYRKDTPIGLTYCSLAEHETGGFIQIDLNSMLFEELRSSCKYGDTKFAEFNLAFGGTRKLFNFLWIHYGPGVTFKLYHGTYLNKKYPKIGYGESDLLDLSKMGEDVSLPKDEIPEKYEDGWKDTNIAIAISPIVGIDIKLQFIVFRLSYQYRLATQSKLGDFIGRSRFSFGAGIAF